MLLTNILSFKNSPDKQETKISDIYGIIYRIYCKPEDKSYVGQTFSHRKCKEKYMKSGVLKRIKEHYKVKNDEEFKSKFLSIAFNQYSTDDFIVYEEEKVYGKDLALLNKIEGKYIEKYNSLHPNGYNLEEVGKIYSKLLLELSKYHEFEIQKNNYVDKTRPKRCKDLCFGKRFNLQSHKFTKDIIREKLNTINIESIRLLKSKNDTRMIVREVDVKDNIRIYMTQEPDELINFAKEFTKNIIISESFKQTYKYQNKLDKALETKDITLVISKIYHNSASNGNTYVALFYGKKNDDRTQLLMKVSFGGKTISIEDSIKVGLEFIEKYKLAKNDPNIIYDIVTESP